MVVSLPPLSLRCQLLGEQEPCLLTAISPVVRTEAARGDGLVNVCQVSGWWGVRERKTLRTISRFLVLVTGQMGGEGTLEEEEAGVCRGETMRLALD